VPRCTSLLSQLLSSPPVVTLLVTLFTPSDHYHPSLTYRNCHPRTELCIFVKDVSCIDTFSWLGIHSVYLYIYSLVLSSAPLPSPPSPLCSLLLISPFHSPVSLVSRSQPGRLDGLPLRPVSMFVWILRYLCLNFCHPIVLFRWNLVVQNPSSTLSPTN
jgi:hypothetical protein